MKTPVFIQLSSSAFGHQVLDYEQIMFNVDRFSQEIHPLFYQSRFSANEYFLSEIKKSHLILPHFPFWIFHRLLLRLSKKYSEKSTKLSQADCEFLPEIHTKTPCNTATLMTANFKRTQLNYMGRRFHAKLAGLVVRDHGYELSLGIEHEKHLSRHRNSSLGQFAKAIHSINDSGYEVCRFGRHKVRLDLLENVVLDLESFASNLPTDSLDFHVAERCEFFISTGSGPDVLSMFFRKPLFLVNTTYHHLPTTQIIKGVLIKDYYSLNSKGDSRKISFNELVDLYQNPEKINKSLENGEIFSKSKSKKEIDLFVRKFVLRLPNSKTFKSVEVLDNIFY